MPAPRCLGKAAIPDNLDIPMDALTAALVPMLRAEEGLRLTVYDDASGVLIKPGYRCLGHPTIGIGRALDVNGITDAEADYLLGNDIAKVTAQLDGTLPWWRGLTTTRQVVLAGMAFQMGVVGLLAFKNTLTMVRSGDYVGAARGMLSSRWATQTPGRAVRMAQMMEHG